MIHMVIKNVRWDEKASNMPYVICNRGFTGILGKTLQGQLKDTLRRCCNRRQQVGQHMQWRNQMQPCPLQHEAAGETTTQAPDATADANDSGMHRSRSSTNATAAAALSNQRSRWPVAAATRSVAMLPLLRVKHLLYWQQLSAYCCASTAYRQLMQQNRGWYREAHRHTVCGKGSLPMAAAAACETRPTGGPETAVGWGPEYMLACEGGCCLLCCMPGWL